MSGRIWWMAPVVVATVGGGAFAAFALPGLAGGASVPNRIVVHRSAPPPPTTPSPRASPTAHVVVPDQPVVHERDDSGGRGG